mmetsp:Transcript_50228/g.116615  ORF Transcript_50228/g.116615 Transcript_50228/m.116615 type:complete len:305 (+) Transcript_50228:98-1012(+)
MSWIILCFALLGRQSCAEAFKTVPHQKGVDILHWEDLQERGANTTGMIPSWLRSVPDKPPPRIFTYNVSVDQVISKDIQRFGVWEESITRAICRVAAEARAGNFLDVGANIGAHTLAVVPCFGNQSSIYSVEAVPSNVEHLVASVLANGYKNVVVVPNAVGSPWDPPTIKMEVNKFSKGASRLASNKSTAEWHDETQVKLSTLDAIAEREPGMMKLLYMKMDIEGSEGRALQGAKKLLSKAPPCHVSVELNPVLLERVGSHFNDVVARLEGAGYDTRAIPLGESNTFSVTQRNLQHCLQRLRGS